MSDKYQKQKTLIEKAQLEEKNKLLAREKEMRPSCLSLLELLKKSVENPKVSVQKISPSSQSCIELKHFIEETNSDPLSLVKIINTHTYGTFGSIEKINTFVTDKIYISIY